MKRSIRIRAMLFALLAFLSIVGVADDTDIFNQPPGNASPAPNILIILDNRPNWSSQSQKWPNGGNQGQSELAAIKNLVANINQPANIGLMMLDVTGHDGGYVRYGVRSINDASNNAGNNAAFQNILTDIYNKVQNPTEKINQSSGNFANALYETWLYLNGANSWEGMSAKADYAGNSNSPTPSSLGLTSGFAYQSSANGAKYNSPIAGNACARTYIIFIGNNDNQMPEAPANTDPSMATLRQYNYATSTSATSPDVQSAWTRFLRMRPDLGSNAASGAVTTYTIDAYSAKQNTTFSTMLQNMAHDGGGQYFVANDDSSMQLALQKIFNQIQAVNSVFSAVSLPVSVSVRSTYLNQVYMGVFRPDANASPNWVGNLKQYQLGVNTATTPPTLFLADSAGANAENPVTGFINPNATSFWTAASSYWSSTYYPTVQGVGGTSDSPDGDLVEKGGAAEYLRNAFASSQASRNLYTCVGTCTSGSTLSSFPFTAANTSITPAMLTPSGMTPITSTEHDDIINWVRGGNTETPIDDDPSSTQAATNVRGHLHGDVLHSRPAVINYGRNSDDIMVFYGANDGILHAVKGGQPASGTTTTDGQEQWGFIAPEFFQQLKRLRDHSPAISSSNPKPYYFDGSITTYTYSTANDGKIDYTRGDKAYLFITMRRGGRALYALDVSNPSAPALLWKHSNTDSGFTELGYTWSDLKVAKLKAYAHPVLIAGMGYDPLANDPAVQGTATMGRGVMIIDAVTGALLWQAGPSPSGAATNVAVPGMTYAIAAAMELVDSDGDGYIDRVYAADTGANLWRINVDSADTSQWSVSELASLGGTGTSARKFLYPPDVVLASSTQPYDAVVLGSGDREHPFDTSIVNQYYMIKDSHALNATLSTPVTQGNMYDATANLIQVGTASQQADAQAALLASTNMGWFVTLGTGEKVVSGSTTLDGSVIFGTNLPATASTYSCTSNLGEARLYSLNYLNGGATIDQDKNGTLTSADRYMMHPGGGYPPTPIPVSVQINGRIYQAAISGTHVISPPGPPLGRRYRTYWYRTID